MSASQARTAHAPRARTRALVLLGHGSHLNASSSAPVYDVAQRIREYGHFDEVIEGFWKEEPSLRDVLDLVSSDEVFVVPLFLAEGYFTRQVLPRELGLVDSRKLGPTIRYCMPVGAHPAMHRLILRRALGALRASSASPDDTTLVIVGHGTGRSPTSGDSVHRLVDELSRTAEFARVSCGFLDEEPRIGKVLGTLETGHVVLVPFFVAEGWHTADTIPRELGLNGELTESTDRVIHYTPPIGTLPEIADVVLEITREAGAFDDLADSHDPERHRTPRPIDRARRDFLDWVRDGGQGGREFLQLDIHPQDSGRFEVRHRADRHLPASVLRHETDPRGALRISRFDARGDYRPLRTAASLASGWILGGLTEGELWQVISLFYPAAALHWYQWRTGTLEVVPFTTCARRQSGAYEGLRNALPEALDGPIESCCGSCSRTRMWEFDSLRSTPATGADAESRTAVVPCREPCTLLRTALRQSAVLAPAEG